MQKILVILPNFKFYCKMIKFDFRNSVWRFLLFVTLCQVFKPCVSIHISPPPQNSSFSRLDEGTAKVWGSKFCPSLHYPFMVGLIRYTPYLQNIFNMSCGGTLVHTRVVLTAASCIEQDVGMKVVVGLFLLQPALLDIAAIRLHPGWLNQKKKIKDNIGVAILRDEVRGIKLLRLPKRRFYGELRPSCETALIISMGETAPETKINTYKDGLSCGEMRLINQPDCYAAYPTLGRSFFDSVVCTYNKDNTMGVFRNDAGSPLICGSYQIGIVSFSIRYKVPLPNVFTRVDYYTNWIRSKFPKKQKPPQPKQEQDLYDEANYEENTPTPVASADQLEFKEPESTFHPEIPEIGAELEDSGYEYPDTRKEVSHRA